MNKNTSIYAGIAIIFVGGLVSYFLFSSRFPVGPSPTPKSKVLRDTLSNIQATPSGSPRPFVPTLGGERYTITQTAKLDIPEVSSSKTVTVSQIPSELERIIKYGSSDVLVKEIVYQNGKTGWRITFVDGSNSVGEVAQYYLGEFHSKNGWTLLKSTYGQYFGMLEAEKDSYSIRVSIEHPDHSVRKINVTIEIVTS